MKETFKVIGIKQAWIPTQKTDGLGYPMVVDGFVLTIESLVRTCIFDHNRIDIMSTEERRIDSEVEIEIRW